MVAQVLSHNTGGLVVVATPRWDDLQRQIRQFDPKSDLGKVIKACFRYLPVDLAQEMLDTITRCVILESSLALVVLRHPDSPYRHGGPLREDLGVVSRRVVTTAGATALCVAWANASFDAKYMALGTGSGAPAVGDTALTEITNTHYTGGVRVTCTHVESTNTVPIVGTHTQATAGDTIEEHGIFTSATVGNATLWDRHTTGSQVLAVSDGLQGTYTLTANTGG